MTDTLIANDSDKRFGLTIYIIFNELQKVRKLSSPPLGLAHVQTNIAQRDLQ